MTALARGLQILRCFDQDRSELAASEIVRHTGLPQPTVWRLCRTLEKSGFLIHSAETGKMALGIPVLALGYAALARQDLARLALPYMRSITERLTLGMSLAVRDGLDMVYLQRTHGDFAYMNDPVGTRRSIAIAPTGWAVLAGCEDGERAAVLRSLRRQSPRAWRETKGHIGRALADYLARGFILSLGIVHEQLNVVAVPIRSRDGERIHALSAAGLASLWPRAKLMAVGKELVVLARELGSVSVTTA